ncbi:phosphatase PAP2 family protein [Mycolicibacterium llatzerense]|uniref:phosphatase PAP2 family protein n=1 Tax=Mycolicibacterium llatzerense TaxID=280871 RepID=UPI000AC49811|nr:phosphatase PAP2 family protein [Mycolicibacterium llatzerense]
MFIEHSPFLKEGVPPRTKVAIGIALVATFMCALQATAMLCGFRGPLERLIGDYVGTPAGFTVPWAALVVALVAVPRDYRLPIAGTALGLDVLFVVGREYVGLPAAMGSGALVVLTGLGVFALMRWTGSRRDTALKGVATGLLLVLATKAGDAWLTITSLTRPTVLDEFAARADHALGQPSWVLGQLVQHHSVLYFLLHWVYLELSAAATVVAIYQLRNVTTGGRWPRHFVVRTFLVLGLIGPLIYLMFPLVGPTYAFGPAGGGFQVGDFWPALLPPVDGTAVPIAFDTSTPRNCMPSLHTAWALAVFIHSRSGPRWLRIGGTCWLVGTLAATLGFGFHYGVDLVVGAALCLTVESALREPVRPTARARLRLIAGGVSVIVGLMLCVRHLSDWMAAYPIMFGLLIIGAFATLAYGFYATFFSHPGTSAPAIERLTGEESESPAA